MKHLLRKAFHALWHDEMAARRWARGLLIGFGATAATVVPLLDRPWNVALALGAGLAACVGGLVSVGEPNPKPPAEPPAP